MSDCHSAKFSSRMLCEDTAVFVDKAYVFGPQVVNAIHGLFKNGYFSSIYILANVSSLSIIMLVTSDLMVCMNC